MTRPRAAVPRLAMDPIKSPVLQRIHGRYCIYKANIIYDKLYIYT